MTTDPRPRRWPALAPAALSLLVLAGAAALLAPGLLRNPGLWKFTPPAGDGVPPDDASRGGPPRGPGGPPPAMPPVVPPSLELMDVPGVSRPPARPAAEAGLADDAEVVGVLSRGRARAYLVDALSRQIGAHIINDVLGGAPVSVTHCPLFQCTRVFTGEGDEPLALRQGGLTRGGMVLRWDGWPYFQETQRPLFPQAPAFPLRPHAYELTTWGAWRRAHPDTDVYLGPEGEGG